jgi:hypothetical protein
MLLNLGGQRCLDLLELPHGLLLTLGPNRLRRVISKTIDKGPRAKPVFLGTIVQPLSVAVAADFELIVAPLYVVNN